MLNNSFHLIPFLGNKKLFFKKCIIVLIGPPLTGKSTLGQELAKHSNFTLLDVDEVRQKFFPSDKVLHPKLEQSVMELSYQKNHQIAEELLQKNQPVVLVATYSRQFYHQMLEQLACTTSVPLRIFLLQASHKEICQRLEKRQKEECLSNIKNLEDLMEVHNRFQSIINSSVVNIDTSHPLKKNVQEIFKSLASLQTDF